jgi:hypothetical protein
VQILRVSFKQALALALLAIVELAKFWASLNPLRRLLKQRLSMRREIILGEDNNLALGYVPYLPALMLELGLHRLDCCLHGGDSNDTIGLREYALISLNQSFLLCWAGWG